VGSFRLGLRWAVGALFAAGMAFGAEPVPSSKPSAVPPPSSPLVVRIESASASVGSAEFLSALFRTLRRPLVAGTAAPGSADAELSIRYDASQRELVVTCYDKLRGSVTRVVEPPADPAAVPETAALLAENLCTSQVQAPPAVEQPPIPAPVVVPILVPVTLPPVATPRESPRSHRMATASFFFPLATNHDNPSLRTNLQFNLLYGQVGELDGFSLGIVNSVEASARGLNLALAANYAGGRASGLHVAGVLNSAKSLDEGAMLSALANHTSGAVRGGQLAFGLNLGGNVRGAQAAGLMNLASGSVEGAQASFLSNVARDLDGVQIGLVNVAARVRGVQIGLVNVADDIDGVPIGLVNVKRSGGVRVLAWGGYTSHANVGLKFATRYTYSMLTFGYRREDEVNAFGPGFVFGVRVPVTTDAGIAFDVGGDYLFGARICCYESRTEERVAHTKDRNHYRLRVLPTWQLRPRFALFAGGGVSAEVPFALYSDLRGYDQDVQLRPDFAAGVEF
jgi:hypothetical protein